MNIIGKHQCMIIKQEQKIRLGTKTGNVIIIIHNQKYPVEYHKYILKN